jgi:hypothetical protein
LNRDIEIFEFEWYLRDFFFRSTSHINDYKVSFKYNKSDIAENIKNKYLRYRDWELTKIEEFLMVTLVDMGTKGVVDFNIQAGKAELISLFERKQCSDCFYVNILSLIEPKSCVRCNSKKLLEFPIKRFPRKTDSV